MPQPPPYNEHELISLFNHRDESAFTHIYETYYSPIYFYIKKIVGFDLAKDITAEVFIDCWRGKRAFESIPHIVAHLRTVARNKCVDQLRKQEKEDKLTQQLSWLNNEQDEINFAETFLGGSIYRLIAAEVEKLPPFHRSIFKLSYYEGLSNAEIATKLQIRDATVRTKKAEALKLLRQALGNIDLSLLLFLYLRL